MKNLINNIFEIACFVFSTVVVLSMIHFGKKVYELIAAEIEKLGVFKRFAIK